MIHATIRMKMPVQKEKEALEVLRSVAERTRVEPGCIILLVVEMAHEKPEISFCEFSGSTGVETIEKARTQVR